MTATLQEIRGQTRLSTTLLGGLLLAHNIMPLAREKVEAYKEQERLAAPPSTWLGRLLEKCGIDDDHPLIILLDPAVNVLFSLGLVTMVFGIANYAGFLSIFSLESLIPIVAISTGFLAVIMSLSLSALFDGDLHDFAVGEARWVTIDADPVWLPRFVVSYMDRIRAWDDSVSFEVEDLRQNKYSLDPILYAIRNGEREAICIWKNDVEVRLS